MFSSHLIGRATDVLAAARARGLLLATAESCTGGLIAGLLTEIPGSSDVFERGFVTYSNDSKQQLLGVPEDMMFEHGAVSEAVAGAMAEGALKKSYAHLAVAVTGIAGPGGGTEKKPVGLVFIAARRIARVSGRISGAPSGMTQEHRFGDLGRTEIRLRTVEAALSLLETLL